MTGTHPAKKKGGGLKHKHKHFNPIQTHPKRTTEVSSRTQNLVLPALHLIKFVAKF